MTEQKNQLASLFSRWIALDERSLQKCLDCWIDSGCYDSDTTGCHTCSVDWMIPANSLTPLSQKRKDQ